MYHTNPPLIPHASQQVISPALIRFTTTFTTGHRDTKSCFGLFRGDDVLLVKEGVIRGFEEEK